SITACPPTIRSLSFVLNLFTSLNLGISCRVSGVGFRVIGVAKRSTCHLKPHSKLRPLNTNAGAPGRSPVLSMHV
ncbi:MAG: hypothetical protein ACRD6N_15940, partial [Pyrinomonadaceae bacterium]